MPIDVLSAAVKLLSPLASLLRWRRISVEVHTASLIGETGEKVFINVVNLDKADVEIVRVRFAVTPRVDVVNPARPLPRRLKPDESWETWIDLRSLPTRKVDDLARVHFSSRKIVKSKARGAVAAEGIVPGQLI